MNNKLKLLRWFLFANLLLSVLAMIITGWQLWRQKQLEAFVTAPQNFQAVPDHPRTHFAQAIYLVDQGETDAALEQYTLVLGSDQSSWLSAAYYNRGNINLREALDMQSTDPRMIPLVELAKQDYRSALQHSPALWDARYNLEVALRMVPEDPELDSNAGKQEIYSERSIETKAFKVDLP